MAEFLNWRHLKHKMYPWPEPKGQDGFAAMGKPIPTYRKHAADQHCKAMGLEDAGQRMACIDGMANALERDEPYQAMAAGMKYLDLTGTYRLMSVLLIAEKPAEPVEPFDPYIPLVDP